MTDLPCRLLARSLLLSALVLVGACGDGSGELEAAAGADAGSRSGGHERPASATRAGEVAELSYTVSGAVSESHREAGNVMCSTTTQGELLAQNFGGQWTVSLRAAGTGPGTHRASLELGPPDRDGLRDGDWRRDLRGSAAGEAILRTGGHDGYGNVVLEIDFDFPEVTLERSRAVVGVHGSFRCGVLGQG